MKRAAPEPDRVWGERYGERAPHAPNERHTHGVALLACLEAGCIELRSALGSWVVFPRSVTFVPPDFAHLVRALTPDIRGWVLYLPASRTRDLGDAPWAVEMSPLLLELCLRIVELGRDRPVSPRLERIVAVTLDELKAAEPANPFRIPLPAHTGLLRVANAILSEPDDARPIDYWAKRAAMSRRSFTRYFLSETGSSFGAWRQRVKVHAALRLLARGASVTEVALELGYQSTSSFIGMFRKCVGASPTRYTRGLAPRPAGESSPPGAAPRKRKRSRGSSAA